MLRAAKVRIYPTPEQAEYLNGQFGAVRFAYNKALHIKKHTYKRHGVSLNPRKDLKPLLAVAKKSHKYACSRHMTPSRYGCGLRSGKPRRFLRRGGSHSIADIKDKSVCRSRRFLVRMNKFDYSSRKLRRTSERLG